MIEIGPNLLNAILAVVGVTMAAIALLRQVWTDKQVIRNGQRLDAHQDAIKDIKQVMNGGARP